MRFCGGERSQFGAADQGGDGPARCAGGEGHPDLVAAAGGFVQFAVARAASEVAVGQLRQRGDGFGATRQRTELGEVGVEQLVVPERRALGGVESLDDTTEGQHRVGVGQQQRCDRERGDAVQRLEHVAEQFGQRPLGGVGGEHAVPCGDDLVDAHSIRLRRVKGLVIPLVRGGQPPSINPVKPEAIGIHGASTHPYVRH